MKRCTRMSENTKRVIFGRSKKEVLGIYVSGHPLEEQEECWRKNISAVTTDFQPDEETGFPAVKDGVKRDCRRYYYG